jgi:hypothetical protein
MSEIILRVEDGTYYYETELARDPKHRADTAFRAWLKEHGQDGVTYIAVKCLTDEITVKEVVQKSLLTAHPKVEKPGKELKEVAKK